MVSLAKRNWREFEKIALEYVREVYKREPDIIYLTQERKDGGYDGELRSNLSSNTEHEISHITMLEAKLRSSSKGLELGAFSKTLIIAYNRAAHTLFIVTNRGFGPQARNETATFSMKTNLSIQLVSGELLGKWLLESEKPHSSELVKNILEHKANTNLSESTKQKKESTVSSKFPKTGIEKFSEVLSLPLKQVFGAKRQEVLKELESLLKTQSSIVTLEAESGLGKTTLIQNLVQTATHEGINSELVDLSLVHSSRALFLKLIHSLSGLDLIHALSQSTKEELFDILAYCGGKKLAKKKHENIIHLISQQEDDFTGFIDINYQILSEYLAQLTEPHLKRQKHLLCFTQLNRATPEVLQFLSTVIAQLKDNNISILIELQRSSLDQAFLSSVEWEQFQRLFKEISYSGCYLLPPLSEKDAYSFVSALAPGIGEDRANVIIKRVGVNPFLLEITLSWLRSNQVLLTSENQISPEKLDVFFEGINPYQVVNLFDKMINHYWNTSEIYPWLICSLVVFGDQIPFECLTTLFPDKPVYNTYEKIIHSDLFKESPEIGSIKARHEMLLLRMVQFAQERRLRLKALCDRLLPWIEKQKTDDAREWKVRALSCLPPSQELIQEAKSLASSLAKLRNWTKASYFYDLAVRVANDLPKKAEILSSRIDCLLELLYVEKSRNRLTFEENQNKLQSLIYQLKVYEQIEGLTISEDKIIRVYLLEWRLNFLLEQFKKANEIAVHLKNSALKKPSLPSELRGQCLHAVGLTLKVLEQKRKSLVEYNHAIKLVPDSISLLTSRLSNIAAYHLTSRPHVSLDKYKKIIRILEDNQGRLESFAHHFTDIAMALFLMKDYSSALDSAYRAIRFCADNEFISQEGRARNIAACCYWTKSDFEKAYQQFDMALFALERSRFLRFLWRTRTNIASCLFESGNVTKAVAYAKIAIYSILTPRDESINLLMTSKNPFQSRWFAAVLKLVFELKQRGLMSEIEEWDTYKTSQVVEQILDHISNLDEFNQLFAKTNIISDSRLMVTG